MFGHDDNQQQQPADNQDNGMMQAAMPDPIPDGNLGDTPVVNPTFSPAPSGFTAAPSAPNMPDFSTPEIASVGTPDKPSPSVAPDPSPTSDPSSPAASGSDDLVSLKQQALQHLSPLVSHLDQTPEEKFRTTMMMIQASDDQTLIKAAFEAAQLITDDKARAQALLDVINEINYFTQHSAS